MQSIQQTLKTILPNKVSGLNPDYFNESEASTGKLRSKLNEADISTKIDALTRVLAMSSLGTEVVSILPDVVRQFFTEDSQVKRLAHMCLVLHANENPELVLLCVNSLLKDASDVCALHRGVSVRTTCLIKTRETSEHAFRAIKKASSDSSIYVRKSAAVCVALLPKGVEMELCASIMDRLLSDYEPSVVSTAVLSLELFPIEFLHSHFRRLIFLLPSLDFVGQCTTLLRLREYSLVFFKANSTSPDLLSFLAAIESLVQFTPECVVVKLGIQILREFGNLADYDQILARHLYKLPTEFVAIFLQNISIQNCELFYLNLASDSPEVQLAKLGLLKAAVTPENAESLFLEISDYLRIASDAILGACMAIVTAIAELCPDLAQGCVQCLIRVLMRPLGSSEAAVIALRRLLSNSTNCIKGVLFIAENLDRIKTPVARVAAFALLSRFHDQIALAVPNALRVAARTLPTETGEVKLQVLILAEQVLHFFNTNSDMPVQVVGAIKGPLQELVQYIRGIVREDELVGPIANWLHVPRVLASAIEFIKRESPTIPLALNAGIPQTSRPEKDSDDSIRNPRQMAKLNEGSCSSQETATNRMSSNVIVPSTKPPKVISTLADLDFFFTQETVVNAETVCKLPETTNPNGRAATIDLSNVDWYKLPG